MSHRGLLYYEDPNHAQCAPLEGVYQAVGTTGISVAKTTDSEAWNGSIASKYQEEVNCSHSYRI